MPASPAARRRPSRTCCTWRPRCSRTGSWSSPASASTTSWRRPRHRSAETSGQRFIMRAVLRGPRLDSDRGVALTLAGLVAVSIVLRLLLVSIVEAPTVFNDELGYMKLAQSIGLDG